MLAGGFSTHELDVISQLAFSTALSSYSNETEPARQAADVLAFAVRYNLVDALVKNVLTGGADRPGFQMFLLGNMDNMSNDGGNTSRDYAMLRIESKIDQIIAEQARQSSQIIHLAQQQTLHDQRLLRLEGGNQSKPNAPAFDRSIDRILVIALAVFMVALMAYTFYGAR